MIVLVNHSRLLPQSDLEPIAVACTQQLGADFGPAYHRRSRTVHARTPRELAACVAAGMRPRVVSFFDHADQADALGWHTKSPEGLVYSRVFMEPILSANGTPTEGDISASVTCSHEILEMELDPGCNLWVKGYGADFWAFEPCDPVEASSYRSASVSVSNFVCPGWWDASEKIGAQFDFLGHLSAPFALEAGGYAVKRSDGVSSQIFGAAYPEWRKASKSHPVARTARRLAV